MRGLLLNSFLVLLVEAWPSNSISKDRSSSTTAYSAYVLWNGQFNYRRLRKIYWIIVCRELSEENLSRAIVAKRKKRKMSQFSDQPMRRRRHQIVNKHLPRNRKCTRQGKSGVDVISLKLAASKERICTERSLPWKATGGQVQIPKRGKDLFGQADLNMHVV